MRIPLHLTLFEKPAPEDNALQISWDVQASADVRWVGATWNEPGEQTVEDIRLDAVTAVWLTYGEAGSVIVPADAGTQFARRETDRTLNWLRTQLPERDDWLERLTDEAARRAPEFHVPLVRSRPSSSLAMPRACHTAPERAAS